jgi:hypothetical protein
MDPVENEVILERTELLSANREADAAVVRPLETAVVFTADRAAGQQAVYISSHGDVAPIASDPPAKRSKVANVRSFFKPHPAWWLMRHAAWPVSILFPDEIERVSMFMMCYNMCYNVCYNLTYVCFIGI